MPRLRAAGRWWVALWDRREPATVLALVRIVLGAVLLTELVGMGALGLGEVLYAAEAHGGLSRASGLQHPPWWMALAGDGRWAASALLALLAALSALWTAGVGTRVTGVALLLLYAQTAQILPLSDRAIDQLIRNVLLILAFSRCGAVWSVDARIRTGRWAGHGDPVPAWPRYLLVLQLVVVYFTAGVSKFGSAWWPWGDLSALYLILHEWPYAAYDVSALDGWPFYRLTQVGTAITVFFQVTYPVVLLHYFPPPGRPGAIRRALARYRVHWLWIGVGALFHVGIGISMSLGIFPWGMLAMYPAFLHPHELGSLTARWSPHPRSPSAAPPRADLECAVRSLRSGDRADRGANPQDPGAPARG